jgi:hypothetical protein
MSDETKAENYFRTLDAVRQTTGLLLKHPEALEHFDVDLDALSSVTGAVLGLIQRDYASPSDIPPHSRWRHFEPFIDPVQPTVQGKKKDRVGALIQEWTAIGIDKKEIVKRLLDLFIVSVLLDAGAGAQWKYAPPSEPGVHYTRSEGLALASLDWFLSGGFSSDPQANPHQVDASKLESLTVEDLRKALQVSDDTNPLVGQERISLLVRLGAVCKAHPKFFGLNNPRPGNLLDFLLQHPSTTKVSDTNIHVQVSTLWQVVVEGIAGVWPATRTKLNGVALGDVWPCQAMSKISSPSPSPSRFNAKETQSFVAFHKLSQWLTYSLMEPLSLLGIYFQGLDKMTGLAEYRNGGLFVDMGVLTLKPGEW